MLFVTGSSAGAHLTIQAVCEGETGLAGLICRYGTTAISRPAATCHHARGARR
jgi:poly(3-hydroxybutyrate) depolymerase